MAKCKVVTVCRKRRRLCWSKKGIRSNTAAGGSARRSSSRKSGATKCRKANGQIKKGCHMTRSGRLVR